MLESDDKCDCDCIAHIVFLLGLIAFTICMLTAQPVDEQCIDKQPIEYVDEHEGD